MRKKISKDNFSNRVDEARALARFAKIASTTRYGWEVILPGHESKQYRVIVKKCKDGLGNFLSVECGLKTSCGYMDCLGNSHNVCYHSMAAIVAVANASKVKVAFAVSEDNAMKLVNIKTRINRVISKQSHEKIYMIS